MLKNLTFHGNEWVFGGISSTVRSKKSSSFLSPQTASFGFQWHYSPSHFGRKGPILMNLSFNSHPLSSSLLPCSRISTDQPMMNDRTGYRVNNYTRQLAVAGLGWLDIIHKSPNGCFCSSFGRFMSHQGKEFLQIHKKMNEWIRIWITNHPQSQNGAFELVYNSNRGITP